MIHQTRPSRGQFARWLSGDLKGIPHPDHCRVLEAMFPGLTARQLVAPATDAAVASAATAVPGATADAPPPAPHLHVARPVPTAPDPTPGPPAPPPVPVLTPVTSLAPHRRLAAAGPAAPAAAAGPPAVPAAPDATRVRAPLPEEVAMATDESARFVRGARGAVDQDVLDQLAADVRRLAADYISRPPIALFLPLSRLRHEVFEMLDRRQRPALLPPLYGVAGRLCALLAHASGDLGNRYAAETHTRTAWLCADLAEDDGLRSFVRWAQSQSAHWAGDHRRAAQIAQAGQRHATSGSSLLRLASQEARAWAAAGEAREVERALATAAAAAERLGPPGPGADPDEVGVFRFDPGKAAYYASEVRLSLGGDANARLAVRDAEESLHLYATGPDEQRAPEFVAAARLDLAGAHLALDALDGAADELRTVLTLPVESRTTPIVARVASAGETLSSARFAHSPLAAELVDEIAVFRAYPARHELPEVPL